MFRRIAPLLALALATTVIANPAVETKRTLRMRIEGMRQILVVPFASVSLSAPHQNSTIIGNVESGLALGDRGRPATLTFELAIPADDDGSVLKAQLNRGRAIIEFRSVEETPLDNGMASFSQYHGEDALVGDLHLSGSLGSMKGKLTITSDHIEITKKVAAASPGQHG